MPEKLFRVLTLDGGGAKGFYTLGILREIEAMISCPLHERFDLIFGTSTGSIITAMLALGKSVPEIIALYQKHVPTVMENKSAACRSAALADLSEAIFGDAMFADVKTSVGIVTTKWVLEKPMIFKTHIGQAHGMKGSFVPGFGVKVGDAVQASCSAYPYFNRKTVTTSSGDSIELIDGGFCANNPTLYAIADATVALGVPAENIRVVSLGCGNYPPPPVNWWTVDYWKQKTPGVQLLQKTLEINTQSMDQLRVILYKHIQTVRISQSFSEPAMATDLFEHDLQKLNVLTQRGAQSFAEHEQTLQAFLL
ncbi:patatin-like phospholipase family protein [Dyella sp.]|uniref:patatin-like phospholipase family protein n=1 Tax=Dyella sp. TaxID=1869338 RepID=UPI002D78291B|nr:patatin-like phospholipase family protein [Dyella sp.]HET6432891.1 patatin-like phospholipase family protein [Dyella sp.]